jgi:uroporphyrinogen decarboxylase
MPMTHRERILAAIRGEPVDRVPIALWRHFPGDDGTSDGLAAAVVAFQSTYDFDLVKVTPASGYPAEAWGARLEPAGNEEGTRRYLRRVVASASDWRTLRPLDVHHGVFGRELKALQKVRAAVGADVHVLQTIFSPLTVAKQMVGPDVVSHLRAHPDDVDSALAVVSETTARFARASLEHGADGIFFAAQLARTDLLTAEEYRRHGLAFDMPILDAVRPHADLVLLHLCGENVMFDLTRDYAPDAVNWHDQTTPPALSDALARLPRGAVVGGLDRGAHLERGTPEAVRRAVEAAVAATGGRRLIVGAGCVTLVTTPPENLRAARDAVESVGPAR